MEGPEEEDPELLAAIALSLSEAPQPADGRDGAHSRDDSHAGAALGAAGCAAAGQTHSSGGGGARVTGAEACVGRFLRLPVENAWHAGSITMSVQGRLRWDNDAGVGWSLAPAGGGGGGAAAPNTPTSLVTGETNPYLETQPAFLVLRWADDGRLQSFVFGNDKFTRGDGAAAAGASSGGGSRVAFDHAMALLATHPRSVLKPSVAVLQKLVGNVADRPDAAKFRTVRKDNPKIASALRPAGATEFLLALGWQHDAATATLTLPDAAGVPGRLKAAHQSLANVLANADDFAGGGGGGGSSSSAGEGGGVPDGHFRCSECGRVVCNDDTLEYTRGAVSLPQGEFKYKCEGCASCNLCRKCFEGVRQGRIPHDPSHRFEHVPPKTNEYGWGRGLPPPPPPPNSRNSGGWKR